MKPLHLGIIGGTGLAEALQADPTQSVFPDTPFGQPSGPILRTRWQGVEISILSRHGSGHVYHPTHVPFRANIFALKTLGVTHILASGAAGSLREHIHPGDLVLVDQVIDKTHRRAGTFYEHAAVHVEFSHPFCPVMRQWLLQAAQRLGHDILEDAPDNSTAAATSAGGSSHPSQRPRLHARGTYVCMEGPAFSTVAESNMHRLWGADIVGMTAMPEAKLAREAEMAYALLGLPTDYDCWRPHDASLGQQELLKEIMGNLDLAVKAGLTLIQEALRDVSLLQQSPSPAHDALQLAIWSDKKRIPAAEIHRLAPLWGRYFPSA